MPSLLFGACSALASKRPCVIPSVQPLLVLMFQAEERIRTRMLTTRSAVMLQLHVMHSLESMS